ncbi:MAG TPA: tryptophan--tRNA ligase [Candidatus Saccharibacteria bacterium]|nr:tryptophan--tRNA ligase [Candidatus Saccharibacteria bacterium]
MTKPVILTGLRANSQLHIGNYFGALLPLIDMAKKRAGEHKINLFVPDLHSFTTPIDHSTLHDQIMNNLRMFVAAGLPIDHNDVCIYRQSYVPAHSELTWILDCFTGFGEMSRMTQYKDKSSKLSAERTSVGLFNYPVLMAADILLYGATYVPVGDDQSQHLEFTRDIAMRMNAQFGDLFTVPLEVKKQHEFFGKDQGLRIKDLVDPSKKMSKSDNTGKGVIFLTDTPEIARKKIMGATTDSIGSVNFNPQKQPGISNLLQVLALFRGETVDNIASEYAGQTSYGDLKKHVADATTDFLVRFQETYAGVDDTQLTEKLHQSEVSANTIANATLDHVQRAIGLR